LADQTLAAPETEGPTHGLTVIRHAPQRAADASFAGQRRGQGALGLESTPVGFPQASMSAHSMAANITNTVNRVMIGIMRTTGGQDN
jgi:hypothetical protein